MVTRRRIAASLAGLPILGASARLRPARAAEAVPRRIRVGVPMAGIGGRPYSLGSYVSAVHAQGRLEQEFSKDGTEIVWHFYAGAGPAVNEGLAEGALDFAWQGDLPEIVARSRGLATRQLAVAANRIPFVVAVSPKSDISSLADLKGKTVANFQGTTMQLVADRALATVGLREQDLQMVNLDSGTGAQAVLEGQIDATFAEFSLMPRLAKLLKIVFVAGAKTPELTSQSSILATDSFATAYPDAVDRVVRVAVEAAYWSSQAQNRAALYALWGKSGYPQAYIQAAFDPIDLQQYCSPLWDDFATAQLDRSAVDSARYGLIRTPVSVQSWIDDAPLKRALASTGLGTYWPRYSADGKSRLS